MKKTYLSKLTAGLFVIGVFAIANTATAVPTFTFSPLEGGSKTLLTLSGQTDDRSDPRTVPDGLYNHVFDSYVANYFDTESHYGNFRFTEGLEGLTVTSTKIWAPRIDLYPFLEDEENWPDWPGYPMTETRSATSLHLGDQGETNLRDEFIFDWPEYFGLHPSTAIFVTETLTFSGSAVLDLDFSQLNPGTYRGAYLGQPILEWPLVRDGLIYPTFEIVVTPEPASMSLLCMGTLAILRRR